MTEIKDINIEIAQFLGNDLETLSNMGQVHVKFKEDVVDLLEKALIHAKKMRVMKELLEYAEGPSPMVTHELERLMIVDEWLLASIDLEKINRFYMKQRLWLMVSDRFWDF
jgi:hypothetical protein